jgi:SAM-dependent methyltransferase
MLARLRSQGFTNISGFDLSKDAIEYTVKNGATNVQLLNILDSDKAYSLNSFDIIISHDIICLLNDGEDKIALEKLVSLLKPGGLLLMNLPAGRFFKGTHDYAVGINTRYSKKKIRWIAKDCNVEIKEMYHWPFFLSPLILSLRLFQRGKLLFSKRKNYKSDVSLPHPFLNELFYKLTSLENKSLPVKAWGSSIFVTIVKL